MIKNTLLINWASRMSKFPNISETLNGRVSFSSASKITSSSATAEPAKTDGEPRTRWDQTHHDWRRKCAHFQQIYTKEIRNVAIVSQTPNNKLTLIPMPGFLLSVWGVYA